MTNFNEQIKINLKKTSHIQVIIKKCRKLQRLTLSMSSPSLFNVTTAYNNIELYIMG